MNAKNQGSIERPPIVVVLGHVDHGKSTLLDFIRKSNTVQKEAGGITQHVAAYEVERAGKNGKKRITFIDTPGHAAFSAIRSRGANVADIAILVVAADDGVKAQTLEALKSIREANIPYIVAINKIDKPNANLERTQATLMENAVYLEKLGGDVPWTAISGKNGTGVEELLDLILLVAELQEFKGDPNAPAEGFVIEAHRDQKRGIAATLIITNGTLETGHALAAGQAIAPVRIMEDHTGKKLKEATFSTPVVLVGFDQLPAVGESFRSYKSKRDAEEARSAALPRRDTSAKKAFVETDEEGRFVMPIIVRADTSGSLEALEQETAKIGDEYSRVAIVLSGIGNISENDIKAALSSTKPSTIIGFNVETDSVARERAQQQGVSIETFDIIYKLTERLEELLKASRPTRTVEQIIGKARIIKCFSSRKELHVVGGAVEEGRLTRNGSVRVLRRKTQIGIGKIKNIQAHKQDTEKVEAGSEFGAQIETVFEIVPGDILECFVNVSE